MRVFHFMRYKWWFLGTLSAVTVFAIVLVFIVGLDLGIDFKGGMRMQFSLEKAADVDGIRALVTKAGVQEPVVQSVGTAASGSAFMVTADDAGMTQAQIDAQIAEIKVALDTAYGLDEGTLGVDQVGGSFGRETTNRAFIAVAIAVLAIIGYLSFRFHFKFAIPAIVALVHDVGLTLGIYAASNRLVTSATVAAILTILGYSVHDTIIVFDRIRENTLLMKKETYGDMVDLSIRQTMIRSINTTIALLLPLLAILIFGGPTLKDFALALTIGVVSGTYSSFFVAAPLVTIWKDRKRLVAAGAGGMGGVEVSLGAAEVTKHSESIKAVRPVPASRPAGGKTGQQRSGQKTKQGKNSGKKSAGQGSKKTGR
jgi:preprotein translocase SecF subunit